MPGGIGYLVRAHHWQIGSDGYAEYSYYITIRINAFSKNTLARNYTCSICGAKASTWPKESSNRGLPFTVISGRWIYRDAMDGIHLCDLHASADKVMEYLVGGGTLEGYASEFVQVKMELDRAITCTQCSGVGKKTCEHRSSKWSGALRTWKDI